MKILRKEDIILSSQKKGMSLPKTNSFVDNSAANQISAVQLAGDYEYQTPYKHVLKDGAKAKE